MPFFLALICLNEVKRRQRVPIPTELDALATPPEDPYDRFPDSESGAEELESGSKPGPAPADPSRPEHG